ncbi:MAG: hypothetical protein R3230_00775 [Nitrosopumilaceae archaeon]|nr:hypothetical protein [Nitrosopumilaceae archaeon]
MIQINTPNGWSNFDGIRKTDRDEIISVSFDDESYLNGTPEHLVKNGNDFVELKSYNHKSLSGDSVYDILGVEKNNQYYTNSKVSHNCLFRGSQNSLIAGNVLDTLVERKPILINDKLKVYEEPKDEHIYCTTVDVSRGVGGDYSAFIVFDVTEVPYKVVATYRDNTISPLLFPTIVHSTSCHYNKAMTLVEINDIGEQVANILFYEYEYENLLMTKSDKNRQIIWYGSECKLGVRTTTAVKAIGCSNIKTLIENQKIELNDKTVIDEFGTFIPKGNSYEADSGANDDYAMCCVLLAWATTQQYFKDMTDINTREELLNQRENNEHLEPFGFIDNQIDEEPEPTKSNPFGVQMGTVDYSDPFFDGF